MYGGCMRKNAEKNIQSVASVKKYITFVFEKMRDSFCGCLPR